MSRIRAAATLGGRLAARRRHLGLSRAAAARQAGVNRKTWAGWETDTVTPADRHHRLIEDFCGWAPGSTAAVLAGRAPTPAGPGLASVTPLRPEAAPGATDEDELVRELRAMGLPAEFLAGLIAAYEAEKHGADTARRARYLGIARQARD